MATLPRFKVEARTRRPSPKSFVRPRSGGPLASWFDDLHHPEPDRPRLRFRTVWISDTHLGTSGCNADQLFDFLRSIECETLFLVGDIVDGWQLRKGWYWPARHNDVVRCILKQAGLVCDRHEGRQTHYSAQLGALAPLIDWTSQMAGFWQSRFDDLEDLLKRMDQ